MTRLTDAVNIGPVLAGQLEASGVGSLAALKAKGSRQAWLDIRSGDPSACYNRLCALEGAIQGIRWHDLSTATKEELKAFYQSIKG